VPKALALGLALALAPAAGAALPARVTLAGGGGVVPGMTPAVVARRWDLGLRLDTEFGFRCQTAVVKAGPMRGYALFERRRFGSVFFDAGAVTGRGIRIGSTRADLVRAYGRALTSRPDAYDPRAVNYFVRRAGAPRRELRFDVVRGRVRRIAFGNHTVRSTEGCA
jgi:hypothetical protein